jgi:hypothetical protein
LIGRSRGLHRSMDRALRGHRSLRPSGGQRESMERKLFTSLGKIAGLGGIALGVFLLLFRDLLETQFLSQAAILSLMILTFGVARIGVVAWLVGRTTGPKKPVPRSALGTLAANATGCWRGSGNAARWAADGTGGISRASGPDETGATAASYGTQPQLTPRWRVG